MRWFKTSSLHVVAVAFFAFALSGEVLALRKGVQHAVVETPGPVVQARGSDGARAVPAQGSSEHSRPKKTVAVMKRVAGPPSDRQVAARERMKRCAVEWHAAKAADTVAGQTWPKYFSACSKRLKG